MQQPCSILYVAQFPPDQHGHGGSQRAWHLLNALALVAPVDFVYIHPPSDMLAQQADLQWVQTLCRSVTRIAIPAWEASARKFWAVPPSIGRWLDLMRIGSVDTPRLPKSALAMIGRALPVQRADIVFAQRLPASVIVGQLIAADHLQVARRVVDFDDILSRFVTRELQQLRGFRPDQAALKRKQIALLRQAERRVGQNWEAVSVCSAEDVAVLETEIPGINAVRIPNVVTHKLMPPPPGNYFSLLFIGNLGFPPNVQGLHRFLDEAWPRIRAAGAAISMQVVGFNPQAELTARLAALGIPLAGNVPSLEQYYQSASAVIAPIMFGGGTRIKILEAMAMGRPVVSTSIGAEGLEANHGEHLMIADAMTDFADAILQLAESPALCASLAAQGRALQQAKYSTAAMTDAVRAAILGSQPRPI